MAKTRLARIFVLDDQSSIADSITEILRLHGYEAHARYTSGDVLDLAAELSPDLLIADVALDPNSINGIDLAIYFERFYPQCRVILISGDPTSFDLNKRARRSGHSFLLLAKPVVPNTLLNVVAEALSDIDLAA
ncbi:MAG TPA: response regulator [Terriglobales bacterium]|nr:response regulator [Terriglobales bacterium]